MGGELFEVVAGREHVSFRRDNDRRDGVIPAEALESRVQFADQGARQGVAGLRSVQRQHGNAGLNLIEENERRAVLRPVFHTSVLVALNVAQALPAYCSAFSISARCAFTISTFSLYCSCGVVLIASLSSSMSCFLSASGIVLSF